MNSRRMAIVANSLLALAFVLSSFYIMFVLRGAYEQFPYTSVSLTPFMVIYFLRSFYDGNIVTISGMFQIPNYPFFLFFLSTAINLYIILKERRSNGEYQQPKSDQLRSQQQPEIS